MKKENHHVTPRKDTWAVVKEGKNKATRLFKTKGEAIAYAENLSKNNNSCMVIHKNNGKFEEVDCNFEIKNQHVVPHNVNWAVVTEKRRVARVFKDRSAALRHAYKTASQNNVCMVTHDSNGKFLNHHCNL